jgi:hypothetical protein
MLSGLYRTLSCFRFAVVKTIAVLVFASTFGPARAQNAEVCTQMEAKLKGSGDELPEFIKAKEEYAKKNQDPAKAATPAPESLQFALRPLTRQPSSIQIESSSENLPGGGQAWFEVTDKAFTEEKANICVHLYARPVTDSNVETDFSQLNIQQAYRFIDASDNNIPKYRIIFDVPTPKATFWKDYQFLLVGMVGTNLFNYSTEEAVTAKTSGVVLALVFVAAIYLMLAWATYDPADAADLKGLRFGAYAISPIRITAGLFGDSSISQLQIVLFTFIVAGLLFYLWMRTGLLVSISKDLLYLLGISAVGAGGAKLTATLKSELDPAVKEFIIAKGWYNWKPQPASKNATLANLLLTGGRLDVYKFQVAVFTIVVAAYVLSSGQNDLGDVRISETMLYLIGISQGVYIGGKAISDRTTRIEDAVKKMKAVEGDTSKIAEYNAAEATAKREFAAMYQLVPA